MIDELFEEVHSRLRDLYNRVTQLEAAPTVPSGGGGGAAPADAEYLVNSADATLTNEIVVTAAQGRIIYGDGTPTWNTLNIGTQYQLFIVNAGATLPEWASFDWDNISSAAGADMVHNHSTNAEGGEIPLTSLGSYTQGDLIVGGGADWTDLAIGANNTILFSDGSDPSWQTLSSAGIAPSDATYLVVSLTGDLTQERNLNINNGLTATDGGANAAYTVNLGTPSTLDTTTTNNVTAASHTHNITTTSDGATNHSTILQSNASGQITMDDYFTIDGGQFGISGNELLTVNTAGTFAFSGITGITLENADWIGNSAASARLGFDSSGATDYAYFEDCNVGIGTTSPDAALHIKESINNNNIISFGKNWFTFGSQGGYTRLSWFANYNSGWKASHPTVKPSSITTSLPGDIEFDTSTNVGIGSSVTWDNRMIIKNGGNVGIGTTTPNEIVEATGNILARNPENNSAFIISPSNAGYATNPELYLQSAETDSGNNSDFHLSRNAYFRTSDDTYQYVDAGGEVASGMLLDNSGQIIFRFASANTGTIAWTDYLTIHADGDISIDAGDLLLPTGKGIIHADGNTAGHVLRGDGTRYIPSAIQTGDLPAHASTHESGGSDTVNHDNLVGFAANEHINHTSVTLTAGFGLTGGGDISANRTFDVGAGNGITVNANDVALTTPGTLTTATGNSAAGNHTHSITTTSNGTASASTIAAFNASGQLTASDFYTDDGGRYGISADTYMLFNAAGSIEFYANTNISATFAASQIDFRAKLQMNGLAILLDADDDTGFIASSNDDINVVIAGATDFDFQANTFRVLSGSDIDMADGASITGGAGEPTIEFDSTNDYLEITNCNVGIGTTSPDAALRIKESINNNNIISFGKNWFTFGSQGGYTRLSWFANYNSGWKASHPTVKPSSITTSFFGDIEFDTSTNVGIGSSVTWDNKMIIKNGGNVGIGTTSPLTQLQVEEWIKAGGAQDGASLSGITDTATFNNTPYGLIVGDAGYILDNNNSALNVVSRTNLTFYTNEFAGLGGSVLGLYIDTSGDAIFGGGTSPAGQLHVDQSSATGAQPVLFLDQGDTSEQCIEFSSDATDRDINLWTVDVTGTPTLKWDESENGFNINKSWYVNETTNSDMTLGITINQGANTDHIITFKSSTCSQAMTNVTEADTFGFIEKIGTGTEGGLQITGMQEPSGTYTSIGLQLRGFCNTEDTTSTSNADGAIKLSGFRRNTSPGSNLSDSLSSSGNVVVIANGGSNTTHIFKGDGDIYIDGTYETYDDYNDIALLHGLRAQMVPGLHKRFEQWVDYARPILEESQIVNYNADGSFMISLRGIQILTIDAVRQLYEKLQSIELKCLQYEKQIIALGGNI